MGHFEGKSILITGASSGIGAGLAREFAKQGARVALAARREDRLVELKSEIERGGSQAMALRCDVTKKADLDSVVAEVRTKWKQVDVVVANAGFGVVGRFEKLDLES